MLRLLLPFGGRADRTPGVWKADPQRMKQLQAELEEYELTAPGWKLRADFDPDGGFCVAAVGPERAVRLFVNRAPLREVLANLEISLRIQRADAGELRRRSERAR